MLQVPSVDRSCFIMNNFRDGTPGSKEQTPPLLFFLPSQRLMNKHVCYCRRYIRIWDLRVALACVFFFVLFYSLILQRAAITSSLPSSIAVQSAALYYTGDIMLKIQSDDISSSVTLYQYRIPARRSLRERWCGTLYTHRVGSSWASHGLKPRHADPVVGSSLPTILPLSPGSQLQPEAEGRLKTETITRRREAK